MNSSPLNPTLPPRQGLTYSAVPKILLGLGALCLLVAAATFLAVSWSTLGIGARTAVLAGLTATAAISTLALQRRGLRIAAESISIVTLGLLTLDVYGAAATGLLGGLSDAAVSLLAGGTLALGAACFGLAATGMPRLTSPQVGLAVGIGLATLGGAHLGTGHPSLGSSAGLALGGALAIASRRLGLPVQQWACLTTAALCWLGLTLIATADSLDNPTLHQLWALGSGWALLVSAVGVMLPVVVLRDSRLLLPAASVSALMATTTLTIPVVGSPLTTVDGVTLAVTAAWLAVLVLVRTPLRIVAVAPVAIGSLILVAELLLAVAVDVFRWFDVVDRQNHPFLATPHAPDAPASPLLLVPSALAVLLAIALAVAGSGRPAPQVWAPVAALVTGVTATVTVAAYDIPLAVANGVLALTAVSAAAFATRSGRSAYAVVAVLTIVAGAFGALPSAGLLAAVCGAGLATALWLAVTGRSATRVLGEVAAVPTAALTVVGLVQQYVGDSGWVAVPVLLAVGLLALVRPVVWVEVPAAITALAALPFSLAGADRSLALLALWLLTAGCWCWASALIHESRRHLAAAGAVLMVLALWTRLVDGDVHTVEGYTLPLAAGLLALGLHHLRRDPSAGTAEALLPGLLVATLPSLVLAWVDPVSARGLLLGACCLALVLAGSTLRWSAPLLVGAAVGVLLVLRELGPYAGTVPQFVWIGLAGVLLTVAGITWERQLRDLRRAVSMIGRLR